MRPKINHANVLYMSLIVAMGRKFVVVRALSFLKAPQTLFIFLFFSSLLFPQPSLAQTVLLVDHCFTRRRYLLCVQNLFHDAQESCYNIVRRKMQQFNYQPTFVRMLFIFSRLMGPFNSGRLQFRPFKRNGRVRLPGCPWKILSSNHCLENAARTVEQWCGTFLPECSNG